jgi:hypothetical protein
LRTLVAGFASLADIVAADDIAVFGTVVVILALPSFADAVGARRRAKLNIGAGPTHHRATNTVRPSR